MGTFQSDHIKNLKKNIRITTSDLINSELYLNFTNYTGIIQQELLLPQDVRFL